MEVKVLQTTGTGEFQEVTWDKPEPNEWQIEVQSVMTGVCRSDIDMMMGNFGPLPLEMQGHEGLGIVTKIGEYITDVTAGDYVATRGEPAYGDYYNVDHNAYVRVPELHPRYILEPVACGINCVLQAEKEIAKRISGRVLIIGSGFLAWVAYNTLKFKFNKTDIDVVGRSNADLFGAVLKSSPNGIYDIVIDLGSGTEVFDDPILNNESLVVFGVEKTVTTNFQQLLWKACTMIFPSPRNQYFHNYMLEARNMIQNGQLEVDAFWSRAYNRDSEWQQAFADGNNRPQGYSRGYIHWNINGN